MSATATKTWLVAYDICEPGRLRRVHRQLKKVGATVQYSAFSVEANDAKLQALLATLESLIDPRHDDLRAYHLPQRCPVWLLGVQGLPDGVHVDPATASRLLLASTPEDADAPLAQADLSFL